MLRETNNKEGNDNDKISKIIEEIEKTRIQ